MDSGSSEPKKHVGGATCFAERCIRLQCGFGNNVVLGSIIKPIPVFSKLSEVERGKMAAVLVAKRFKKGTTVIEAGDVGEGLYVIKSGIALVGKKDPTTDELVVSQELGKARFFGEGAQLFNCARGYSVVAKNSLNVWILPKDKMSKLFKQGSKSAINTKCPKKRGVESKAHKKVAPNKKPASSKTSENVKEKSSEVKDLLLHALSDISLFTQLSQGQKEKIVELMTKVRVDADTIVIQEGDEFGSDFYVVAEGEFGMTHAEDEKTSSSEKTLVKTLKPGESFGALALMHDVTRDFTITAQDKTNSLYTIDRTSFRSVVAQESSDKFKQTLTFLRGVEYLKPLRNEELFRIVDKVSYENYTQDQVIIPKGQEPESLYIIVAGEVKMTEYGDDGAEKSITSLKQGDFFGEGQLLKKKTNTEKWTRTSITCAEPVQCLKLNPETFSLISDTVESLLVKQMAKRESIKTPIDGATVITDTNDDPDDLPVEIEKKEKEPRIQRNELRTLGFLGKGSYGHVQLVIHKTTKQTYALKGVMKREIVECGQVDHIVSEKRVMMKMDSPFILKLVNTYKDKDCVYFLLEAALGGELFNVLRARTIIDEKTARYYVASVCLAFDYMHSMNIVYRDLKPENILLDAQGFAKVVDFGFAKELTGEEGMRTHTLCGTPDYLAPEVILGTGHSFGFDWWCIGIFIYELTAGWPPFMDDDGDAMKTYENIMDHRISYDDHISQNARNIMDAFLQHEPADRLGMRQGGIETIKRQSWYDGFDWEGLIDGTLKPPIKPIVKNNTDLTNFDDPEDGSIERTDLEEYETQPDDHLWLNEF